MKTLKIRTKKISSHDGLGKPNIEECVLSLNEGTPIDGFIRFLTSNRYSEEPVVIKVLNGDKQDIEAYQKLIHNEYNKITKKESVDYKSLSEDQASLIASMNERLKALENGKQEEPTAEELKLIADYTELFNRAPHPKMGYDKMKAKIEAEISK